MGGRSERTCRKFIFLVHAITLGGKEERGRRLRRGVCGALLLAAKIMSPAATKRKLCEAAVVPPTSPPRENIIICRGPAQENSEIKADAKEKRRRPDPTAIR